MARSIKFIILILLTYNSYTASSQDMYRTQEGEIIISVISSDTVMKLSNKHILVLLNYQNAKFDIKLDKSNFITGNDSIDNQLSKLKFDIIEFDGKLDIGYINTKARGIQTFGVEGHISTNNNLISGVGHLEHLSSGGNYSCLLTMTFNLKLDELGLEIEGFDLKDDVKIEISEMLLNQDK